MSAYRRRCNGCAGEGPQVESRREFLARFGGGFGAVAATHLLAREGFAALPASPPVNPLAAKSPHFAAKAKAVIHLFMHGGPSQVDTFDPKPLLSRLHGQPPPPSILRSEEKTFLQFTKLNEAPLLAPRATFKKYGKSGLEISNLFENVAQSADDIAVIRSCYHDAFTHGPGVQVINSGVIRLGHPSMGAWAVYGLGSESENLPAYIVMVTDGSISAGVPGYGAGFLPAVYQGTLLRRKGTPILNARPAEEFAPGEQRRVLDLLNWHNQQHFATHGDNSELAARISSYELAFRMQTAVPELTDLSSESESTKKLYGLDDELTEPFGRNCLLARRMVERGVRFIQIYKDGWDAHASCDDNHAKNARAVDKPIAGLLADLKQRGMLETTLLIWGGEFGRTPVTDGQSNSDVRTGDGRDHNPYGFTMWMAGGGIRGGKVIGATDEIGLRAVEDKVHVHDIHATLLSLLGLDHTRLTYFFQGRDHRLTDVGGDNDLAPRLIQG
jgi:Protein of unknown function (DUF1501)